MTVKDKMTGFYLLIRPRYTIFVALVSLTGMFSVTGALRTSFLLPLLVIVLHYMAICIKDDIEDYEVDLQLDKARPLVKKQVSLREAYAGWIGMHLCALPLALVVSIPFTMVMALYILIGVLYAQRPFRLSDRGILGNIFFVWFSVPLPFVAGALAVGGGVSKDTLITAAILWLWVLQVDMLKDFLLVGHNRLETRVSFVMQLGSDKASKIYSLLTVAYFVLYPLSAFVLGLNTFYLLLTTIIGFWFLFVTFKLLQDPLAGNYRKLLTRTYFSLPPIIALSFAVGMA